MALSDILQLVQAVRTARGTSTTTQQNVSPEQTQAMINQMLTGNNGVAQIIASHRSSGLRSSSGSQSAVENLMAKAAAQAALASSSQTVKQSGAASAKEAAWLAGLGAATPILKPIIAPAWDKAVESGKEWGSQLWDGWDKTKDAPVDTSSFDAMSSAFDTYGSMGDNASLVADTADYSSYASDAANAMSSAWDAFGSMGGAAAGGMIVNTGTRAPRQVAYTQSVSDVLSAMAAPNNAAQQGAVAATDAGGDGMSPGAGYNPTPMQNLQMAAQVIAKQLMNPNPLAILALAPNLAKQRGKDAAANMAEDVAAHPDLANMLAAFNAQGSQGAMGAEGGVSQAAINAFNQYGTSGGEGGNSAMGAVGGFGDASGGAAGPGSATSTAASGGMITASVDDLIKLIRSEDKGEKKDKESGGMQHCAVGGTVVGDSTPKGVDGVQVALDGGEFVIPAKVVDSVGRDFFDQLIGKFGYGKRTVTGRPM